MAYVKNINSAGLFDIWHVDLIHYVSLQSVDRKASVLNIVESRSGNLMEKKIIITLAMLNRMVLNTQTIP